ncbi:MAG TPA: thioredoxin domain-containing protein, partial [Actinomycetota bacterium]|nr:thioredoxin domain-containing protein [Actinomycetota bacterium]
MSDARHAGVANRLIDETSPYLLQHAHNPVDWYPWGPEALERAAAENRPLFISIGYAACHWCHVMERESFEDAEVARVMNDNFVCIKVDREERPDIDAIYMDAVQALTGHGGWPMSVWASPEGVPFYGGTYFPPVDRPGMPAFRRVLEGISRAWQENGPAIVEEGRELVRRIAEANRPPKAEGDLRPDLLSGAVTTLARVFDRHNGGFGRAPKFPQPPVLELLLRQAGTGDETAAEMVRVTLRKMALGGIYDQVGGGFARYTVDATWLTPHFEKMLYDNAQLARLYVRAWQWDHAPLNRRVAEETLEYLLRDMHDETGGFYASEDADSEGQEGKFYVWSHDEFRSIAPEAADYYGVTEEGNFEGSNILTAASDHPPADARRKLFEARAERIRPGRDEKILTSWNGLAISALAEAGAAFARPELIAEGEKTARFLLDSARNDEGRLLHSYKDGRARVLGMLEDYAYLAEGTLALWEVTFDPHWLDATSELTAQMVELFWDDEQSGFFSTGKDHEKLILRQKEIIESVTPAPNAVAALVMLRLSLLTGDEELATKAQAVVRLALPHMDRVPQAVCSFLSALDFSLSTPKEVVIVGPRPDADPLIEQIWNRYLPNKVVAGSPPGIESPLLQDKVAIRGQPTAYVCEHFACQAPTSDPEVLAAQLTA